MNLPDHVRPVRDRHGKIRYRFRKSGLPSRYVHGEPGTAEFQAAYDACFDPSYVPRPRRAPRTIKVDPRTFVGRSCVYFIGAAQGPVKIGTTVNLPARLKKLQTGTHVRLQVLACVDGDSRLEAEYHDRFSSARLNGEWFKGAEVRAEISRLRNVNLSNLASNKFVQPNKWLKSHVEF